MSAKGLHKNANVESNCMYDVFVLCLIRVFYFSRIFTYKIYRFTSKVESHDTKAQTSSVRNYQFHTLEKAKCSGRLILTEHY